MQENESIRIAVAETSVIVRCGLVMALKRIPNVKIQPIEILSLNALYACLNTQCPEVLIVNPAFEGYFDILKLKEEMGEKQLRIVALTTSFVDPSLLSRYDESISIIDNMDALTGKIFRLLNMTELLNHEEEDINPDNLSQREREVLICLVKGMTNKEMAEKLYLSIHTIITHRRNITKKLQIHSTAGLTIYALVNKLISINDIKDL